MRFCIESTIFLVQKVVLRTSRVLPANVRRPPDDLSPSPVDWEKYKCCCLQTILFTNNFCYKQFCLQTDVPQAEGLGIWIWIRIWICSIMDMDMDIDIGLLYEDEYGFGYDYG